jgi:hypothetical protein
MIHKMYLDVLQLRRTTARDRFQKSLFCVCRLGRQMSLEPYMRHVQHPRVIIIP